MLKIRSRLIASFTFLVLLPAVVLSAVWGVVGVSTQRQQAFDQLESVATLKEAELNTWTENLQSDLAVLFVSDEIVTWLKQLFAPSSDPGAAGQAYIKLHDRFERTLLRTRAFDELFVMDVYGRVILSTDSWREGKVGAPGSVRYLQEGLKKEYINPPSYTLAVGGIAIVAVSPILNADGVAVGILGGRTSPDRLNEIMLERTGLGDTGETYLVTRSHIMLTAPRFRQEQWLEIPYVFSEGARAAIVRFESGSGQYENYQGVPVLGVYRWIPELEVGLLAERSQAEVNGAIVKSLNISIGSVFAIMILAGVIAFAMTRSIIKPLEGLVQSVGRITSGDLAQVVPVEREDEIGVLAQAFNSMAAQLRDLVGGLEQRVEQRTGDLRQHALQLETSARVSREITSILELDDLLMSIVTTIRQAFGHYYVAIFLADRQGEVLAFGAANKRANDSAAVISRRGNGDGQLLKFGPGSLNGLAAKDRKAYLVNDVTRDSRFLPDPALEDTRSELVIPLCIGESVVGTLDVHSSKVDAFDQGDVQILTSLGDQVAIAIENARLYDRIQELAISEERSRLARELHDSVTQALYSLVLFAGAGQEAGQAGQIDFMAAHLARIEEIAQHALKEMRLLIHELQPLALKQDGLESAIRRRLESVEMRVGINATLLVENLVPLPAHVEENLFRIVQEALNNSLRHASAAGVVVKMAIQNNTFRLEVVDDGVGFDVDKVHKMGRMGLNIMRERVEKLGGTLAVISSLNRGAVINVQFGLDSIRPGVS
ncbi:MAG: GAF domain-containing protein [Anaerolineales bacterium]|nr:GAF domain-containing protein [Anaerolineales bacterium]